MKHDFKTCPSCQSSMQQMRDWMESNNEAVEFMRDEFGMTASEARLFLKTLEVEHTMIDTMEWLIRSQLPQMFFREASAFSGDLN
jgi:hypothetical protein